MSTPVPSRNVSKLDFLELKTQAMIPSASYQKGLCMKIGYHLAALACFLLILNSACIHVPSHEAKSISIEKINPGALVSKSYGDTEISHMIYKPSKWPLESFFTRLEKGEFAKAFHDIDFDYRSSNVDNKALEELINHGLIPVLVKIKNNSLQTLTLDEKQFHLKSKTKSYASLSPRDLPREFSSFNTEAAAANIANVTGIVIAVVGVLVAVTVLSHDHGDHGQSLVYMGDSSDSTVINDTELHTEIHYQDYLVKRSEILPGQSFEGLVFFKVDSRDELQDFTLSWSP